MDVFFRKNGDPDCAVGRRKSMFRLTETIHPLDPATLASAAPLLHVKGKVTAKGGCMSPEQAELARWAECIRRIRDTQDQAAFVELFRHFAPRLKAYLIRSGSDPALAEECAQDVMTTVWRKANLFDASRASAATWIFTIARNRRIDLLRRQRRPEPEDLPWGPEAEPEQDDVIQFQQESAQLGEALNALPENQRSLIEKAYFGDLSHSEIAEVTGLPLGTIKSRIRLALDRLRHAMDRRGSI